MQRAVYMKRQNRQAGFSIVEIVIVVVAIAVIGTAGFFVYQHNKTL
jgi:prepilin-type N-terminal cleavage/methylation domain-containing protein